MPIWPIIPIVLYLLTLTGCGGPDKTKKTIENDEENQEETYSSEEIINEIKECGAGKGEPCTCEARVGCTSAMDESDFVHIQKEMDGRNVLIADIKQLNKNDIMREREYSGCKLSEYKECTLDKKYIEGQAWQDYDDNFENGKNQQALNADRSYMVCTYGMGYIFFKDAGQPFKSQIEEMAESQLYITLQQLEKCPIVWNINEIESYDLKSSIPTYKKCTRKLSQDDVYEINRVLITFDITTPNRIAHFLAQCQVETDGGNKPVEKFNGNNIYDYFAKKYEIPGKKEELGNLYPGDGTKYRGAGAIHLTGRAAYEAYSKYRNDPRIESEGALYVAQNYYWEAAGYYWSIFKPSTANDDRFDLNKKCDNNESVAAITKVVNGGDKKLKERERAYKYYWGVLNN